MPKSLAIIGSGWQAAQCALTLAEMGIDVDLLTESPILDSDLPHEGFNPWPLLLRATVHPRIHLVTNATLPDSRGKNSKTLTYTQSPRFVKEELCTACGDCAKVCPVKIDNKSAIHAPSAEKSVPSTFVIEKEGISSCRTGCPLEINVHGYVALLHQGETQKALGLINQKAPLAGILGRLCTHPCEAECSRQQVDKPLYLQALHRYAADNADAEFIRKDPAGSRLQRVAIIGSGPAGLSAAWELALRGYSPTIFESNSMPGGMLASGIPGFRLPPEIREKEIEAIRKLGVEIKTGQTLGKEITLDSLRKQGYTAFFLAIGAHNNNCLNIPGEELTGVVDCLSWLQEYNKRPVKHIDEQFVVIGGGNSAVDSVRSAQRVSGDARILCVTPEMTAVPEETEEAIREGICIDNNVSVLEILGQNERVTGLRCIKVRNVSFDKEGRISLEQIAGSEFVLPADRVIVAIGQRPDTAKMNLKELKTRPNGTLVVEPFTLETNLKGIFAGGDAVTGSKNVVSAMAAGLRAAESIDRYLKGEDLKAGRILEAPPAIKVDVSQKKALRYPRTKMPALALLKRKSSRLETNLGLTSQQVDRETSRCLNCAGCCECLECERVCQVKAVDHAEKVYQGELSPAGVIDLRSQVWSGDYESDLARAATFAFRTAAEHKLISPDKLTQTKIQKQSSQEITADATAVLCTCGDYIASKIDFAKLKGQVAALNGIKAVHTISQACTPEGASEIKTALLNSGSRRLLLAACRCCNWDQVCYSCTDRRLMSRENLDLELPADSLVEYTDIRSNKVAPRTAKGSLEKIAAALESLKKQQPLSLRKTEVVQGVLVISSGLAGLSAAVELSRQGFAVTVLSDLPIQDIKKQSVECQNAASEILRELSGSAVEMLPRPGTLKLEGVPGHYQVQIEHPGIKQKLEAGAIIQDIASEKTSDLDFIAPGNILERVIKRLNPGVSGSKESEYRFTIGDLTGIYVTRQANNQPWQDQIIEGQSAAARTIGYLHQGTVGSRKSAVIVDKTLCRGCGDCVVTCPLIELKTISTGLCYAEIDPGLCLGCGACLGVCPTGAIKQPVQNDAGLEAEMKALLSGDTIARKNLVFVCNWDGYRSLEKIDLPESYRVIKVSCLSRLHAGLLLKAFEMGAAKVMLIGCKEHACHYDTDPDEVGRTVEKVQAIMSLLGLNKDQLVLRRV